MRGTHKLEITEEQIRIGNESEQMRALTDWRAQREGQVRIWIKSGRVRGTHLLESEEGWTSHDMERILASEGHSLPGEHKGTSQDIEIIPVSEVDSPTIEHRRTSQDIKRTQVSEGHSQTASGEHRGTSWDTERIQESNGHSQSREQRDN